MAPEQVEQIKNAVETNIVKQVETHQGECIAVDNSTGGEWGFKIKNGLAIVSVYDEEANITTEIHFKVKIEIVGFSTSY